MEPSGGLSTKYVNILEGALGGNSSAVIFAMLAIFAVAHSGGAYLRPFGEQLIGKRAYRVIFAGLSLPLAVTAVVFFINHRYDGPVLWNLRGLPGFVPGLWITNFISFFFLYPSTFNLLEVAAVDEPRVHLYETGIIRITRHPQMWGQLMWCVAHTLWLGSGFCAATSLALVLHHAFGCWHGDFRLRRQYGQGFEEVKERTSIVPFWAILQGKQTLPQNYLAEFIRVPYAAVTVVTLGVFFAHPLMIRGSYFLGW